MKSDASLVHTLRKVVSGAGILVLLFPQAAKAHLVTTGLGPIYDGALHVLLSMEDLLPVLAAALLAGLNGPTAGRRMLFSLSCAWLAAGAAGYSAGLSLLPTMIVCGSFLVFGGLTAADFRLSPRLVAILAITLGLVHGWLNGVALSQAQREIHGLIGSVMVIFVLVTVVSAGVISLRADWMRIGVRVAGSWVFACGLLLAGWMLKGQG